LEGEAEQFDQKFSDVKKTSQKKYGDLCAAGKK